MCAPVSDEEWREGTGCLHVEEDELMTREAIDALIASRASEEGEENGTTA